MGGWKLPPADVQQRVAQVLGDEFWPDFHASLQRVRLNNPPVDVTEWYRSPADAIAEKAKNPRAGLYTQHGYGLAVDLWARNAAEAAALAKYARDVEHFHVRTYPSKPRLVHVAAISDANWQRNQLFGELKVRIERERIRRPPIFRTVSD